MDLDPDIRTLLEHEGFVRGLARSLVLDDHRADDLVQETWLAALRNPPRSGNTVRGWLGTVVRNFARQDRRAASRRTHREQRSVPSEASPTLPDTTPSSGLAWTAASA